MWDRLWIFDSLMKMCYLYMLLELCVEYFLPLPGADIVVEVGDHQLGGRGIALRPALHVLLPRPTHMLRYGHLWCGDSDRLKQTSGGLAPWTRTAAA